MNGATPPEHPDDDLLADLAADVLPTHQARAVEAHVMVCARCTALLTDAAQVRELLLADDPGPMPPDVLARIEQVLQIEVAARDGVSDYPPPTAPARAPVLPDPVPRAAPPVRVISPWEDTTTIEAYEAARKRQASAARQMSEESGTSPADRVGSSEGRNRGPRLTRPSRGPSRSRRDVREEVRDVRTGRRGTVLAAAAGVVVLLGLGGYVVAGLLGTGGTDSAATSASSVEAEGIAPPSAAGTGPPVLTTGTNYTQAALAQQAASLVDQVSNGGGQSSPALRSAAATGDAVTPNVPAPAAGDVGNQALRNGTTLKGCLSALHAGGRRPVAVDLATFDGRDAAVIVLNGANGGYEVWAVTRDCRSGNDGTITYLDLTH